MDPSTDLSLTLIGIAVCAGLALLGFRGRFREKTDIRAYRMPWMPIALLAIAVGFMLVVHLVNIFGFETGGGRGPGR